MNLNPTAAHGAIDALVADHAAQELTWQESLAAEQAKTAAVSANLTTAQTRPAAAKVASGQTMFAIAGKYGVTVDQVKGWNPSVDPANMPVGTQLWLINPSTVPAADPTPTPDPVPDPTPDPTPSGALVLGHVAYHDGTSWIDRANKVKAKYGPFQGHMRVYWGVGSSGILSAELKTWLDASPNNRLFANWKPWSTDWAQVASGGRDSVIVAAAKSWAPYAKTGQFLLTFGHEPENDGSPVSDYVRDVASRRPADEGQRPGPEAGLDDDGQVLRPPAQPLRVTVAGRRVRRHHRPRPVHREGRGVEAAAEHDRRREGLARSCRVPRTCR
jgi:LysM repeat protein